MPISGSPPIQDSGAQTSIFYRAPAATWTASNPILGVNEVGQETDTGAYKIGDGATAWNGLSYSGLVGPQGDTGPQGTQGVPGNDGAQGIPGYTPIKGVDYFDGAQGIQGIQGPPGADSTVPGPQGEQGIQGLTGPQGVPGADSTVPGPQGIQGVAGPAGYTPVKGVDYFDGAQGPQGLQGDVGPQGIQGLPGADSTVPGPQGIQGEQGIQGIQGIQGEQGSQGVPGVGVPVGGTTNQVLKKNSNTDYDTGWGDASGGTVSPLSIPIVAPYTAAMTWANMPIALSFGFGTATSARHLIPIDLASYTQVRLRVVKLATAGAAASKLILRYKTGAPTQTVANYVDIGTSEVSVAINVQNTLLQTAWIDLATGAKAADVIVSLVGSGGDGVLDPGFGGIWAEFK